MGAKIVNEDVEEETSNGDSAGVYELSVEEFESRKPISKVSKRNNPSRIRVAWTIFKLKVTRRILAVFLRIHIWYELRNQRKVQPSHKTGQRTRKEVREAVKRVEDKK